MFFKKVCSTLLMTTICLWPPLMFGKIIEKSNFFQLQSLVLEHKEQNPLVLVDLDNCLFEGATEEGHARWFYQELDARASRGLNKKEALAQIYPEWIRRQEQTPVRLLDEQAKEIIQQIQSEGIPVLGFTHRQPAVAAATLKQVADLNIAFSKESYDSRSFTCSFEATPLLTEGVLFIHDLNSKGDLLHSLLQAMKRSPGIIFHIDDGKAHLQSVEEAAKKLAIPYIGLHTPFEL